jgi:hypothetical protein
LGGEKLLINKGLEGYKTKKACTVEEQAIKVLVSIVIGNLSSSGGQAFPPGMAVSFPIAIGAGRLKQKKPAPSGTGF